MSAIIILSGGWTLMRITLHFAYCPSYYRSMWLFFPRIPGYVVTQAELERLKKRFMKLDRCALNPARLLGWRTERYPRVLLLDSDGSGSIDRDEFLSIPQIATNPLASRMIAIFDEECVEMNLLVGAVS